MWRVWLLVFNHLLQRPPNHIFLHASRHNVLVQPLASSHKMSHATHRCFVNPWEILIIRPDRYSSATRLKESIYINTQHEFCFFACAVFTLLVFTKSNTHVASTHCRTSCFARSTHHSLLPNHQSSLLAVARSQLFYAKQSSSHLALSGFS